MRLKTALLLLITLLLAGCTGSEQPTVSFLVFGDPAERRAYESLVAAFHETQDEVRVELSHIPSPRDYRTRLATEFAAGDPPDVTLMNYRRYASFAASGLLEPLGPYLEASEVIDTADFFPIAIEAFQWRGTMMCLPQNISSLVVYYNVDLFDAAGLPYPADDWTWDQFLATAQALTIDADGDGRPEQFGVGIEPALQRLAPFVWQNGGPIVDDPQLPRRLTLGRFPSLEALQWFVDLQLVHGVTPNRTEAASQDNEARFVAGTTAMYLNSRRGTPTYREIDRFRWDVAPLPRHDRPVGILHSDAYCLSATTADKDAAWRFIEFANSPTGQTLIAASGRTVPSLMAVAQSPAFLDATAPPARSNVWLDTAGTLRLVPVMSLWQEVESIADAEIERAFYGDITPADAAFLAHTRSEEYFLLSEFAVER